MSEELHPGSFGPPPINPDVELVGFDIKKTVLASDFRDGNVVERPTLDPSLPIPDNIVLGEN